MRVRAIAWLALLAALGAWPAPAAAATDRIVVSARPNATTDPFFTLELVDPASGAAQPFAGSGASGPHLTWPTWSQDASKIAYFEDSPPGPYNPRGVVLKPVGGGEETLLLGGTARAPSFSRTSDELAYWQVTFPGGLAYYTLRIRSSDGQETRTLDGPYAAFPDMAPFGPHQAAWSPDGTSIAYGVHRGIHQASLVGGDPGFLVPPSAGVAAYSPSYSPDGTRLAYVRSIEQSGTYSRHWQLVVRDIADGSETVIAERSAAEGASVRALHGPQSWSPDGAEITYGALRVEGSDVAATLHAAAADGTGERTLLNRYGIEAAPAWSLSPPVVTIEAPAPDATLTGSETAGAPEQRLTFRVEADDPLAGVCYAVQTDPTPVPDRGSCTNASGPTSAPYRHTTDLRPLIDNGTITDGENVIRVWAYDENGARGSAEVKIVLARPDYYVKGVEIAQAIAPELGALPAVDAQNPGINPIAWSEPAVAGFTIPLIAQKTTLLRIYVGDASMKPGTSATRTIAARVAGGTVGAPLERSGTTVVTAPDVQPVQNKIDAAVNVELPASAAASGSFAVEVNRDQQLAECGDCYPHGNRAELQGVTFRDGGRVVLAPVNIYLLERDGTVHRPTRAAELQAGMTAMLPLADAGLQIAPEPGDGILMRVEDLETGVPGWLEDRYACDVLLARLSEYRLITPGPGGPGAVRWMGIADPPADRPGLTVQCGGVANAIPGTHFLLAQAIVETAVHELGHTLGLGHTIGYGVPAADASVLPYAGIGGAGYEPPYVVVYDKARYGDIMSYGLTRWTSPASWQRMHEAILRESPPVRRGARAASAARAPRRLVTGVVDGDKGVILRSIVAGALAPEAPSGPVVGRIVARNRAQKTVATAPVHAGGPDVPPFIVALPAAAKVASLELRGARPQKRLDRLRASRHAPRGRFVRLARRAPAAKPLTVRWRARDRDRDPLSVIVQARRGKRWQTVTLGPGRGTASIDPSALGSRPRLALRLLIGDGLRTTIVKGRPVRMTG